MKRAVLGFYKICFMCFGRL